MEHRSDPSDIVAYYREFVPHPALRGIVRALFAFTPRAESNSRPVSFELRCAAGDACPSPMFADASASIVFDLGVIFRSDGRWYGSPAAVGGKFIGATQWAKPPATEGFPAAVGAYLHPGKLSRLARVPGVELTDRILVLEELWGRSAAELSERLAVLGEKAQLDVLEGALLRQLCEAREGATAIDLSGLMSLVRERGGRLSVESLATAAGVSRQQLTRVFRERVGMSPKVYCRLERFKSVLPHIRAGRSADWARVAFDAGYADQSHMIAEFRQFSSLTPHMLATERWLHPFIERARSGVKAVDLHREHEETGRP